MKGKSKKKKDVNDIVDEIEDSEDEESGLFDDFMKCPKCGSVDWAGCKQDDDLKILNCTDCPSWEKHH